MSDSEAQGGGGGGVSEEDREELTGALWGGQRAEGQGHLASRSGASSDSVFW